MNKFRKILVIILLISILIGFFCTVNAEKITYDVNYLIPLANNVYTLSNNSKVAENIELKQTLDGNYKQLQDWINNANNNNDKVEIEKSEIDTIEENVRNAGRLLLPEGNQQQGTNTQNNSQSNTNNQQSSTDTQTTQNNNQAKDTTDNTQESSEFGETYYIPKTLQKVSNGVFIAHASTNGNGKYPSPRDETGEEVYIAPATSQKKIYKVYRYKGDIKINNTIAFLMGDMCNNENVGYNKSREPRLYEQMKSTGYDPTKVGPCNTDCSNSIGTMIQVAFTLSNNGKTFNTDTNTSQMGEDLLKAGFELISTSDSTIGQFAKSGILQVGDVLVSKSGTHAVTFIGNYYTSGKVAPSTPGIVGSGGISGYTAEGEEIDDKQNIDEKSFRFSGLPGDVTYEGELTPIRNFFAKIGDFIDYLLGLIFLVIKIIIIGFVNIAYNIFLSIVSLMKK